MDEVKNPAGGTSEGTAEGPKKPPEATEPAATAGGLVCVAQRLRRVKAATRDFLARWAIERDRHGASYPDPPADEELLHHRRVLDD